MSFVAKPDGGMRLVADLVHLNKFVKRPIHPFMSAKDIINQIESDAKYFATLDAKSGYWQLELEEVSRRYTCFITECCLYQYCRAPMVLVSSGDVFCQRTEAALAGIPGIQNILWCLLVNPRPLLFTRIYKRDMTKVS